MSKTYIGIDNGVTGSIGIAYESGDYLFVPAPVKVEQDYTKTKKNITRIDVASLKNLLSSVSKNAFVAVERPMVNPKRFVATTSALRALEATIIVLEDLNLPYMFIDSKEWQKEMLPKGVLGSKELKKASLDIGNRLFPQFKEVKAEDRDGILIAEYIKRKRF